MSVTALQHAKAAQQGWVRAESQLAAELYQGYQHKLVVAQQDDRQLALDRSNFDKRKGQFDFWGTAVQTVLAFGQTVVGCQSGNPLQVVSTVASSALSLVSAVSGKGGWDPFRSLAGRLVEDEAQATALADQMRGGAKWASWGLGAASLNDAAKGTWTAFSDQKSQFFTQLQALVQPALGFQGARMTRKEGALREKSMKQQIDRELIRANLMDMSLFFQQQLTADIESFKQMLRVNQQQLKIMDEAVQSGG